MLWKEKFSGDQQREVLSRTVGLHAGHDGAHYSLHGGTPGGAQ